MNAGRPSANLDLRFLFDVHSSLTWEGVAIRRQQKSPGNFKLRSRIPLKTALSK